MLMKKCCLHCKAGKNTFRRSIITWASLIKINSMSKFNTKIQIYYIQSVLNIIL